MVDGKPHARDEDHEAPPPQKRTSQEGLSYAEQKELGLLDEDDINAEPASSDDERLRTPPKSSKPIPDSNALKKPMGSSRKRKAASSAPNPEPSLKRPARTKSRSAAFLVPKTGHFERSQAAKEGREGDKENTAAKNTPPSSSQANTWGFGPLSQPSPSSQKGRKVTFGGKKKTANIHTAPVKKTFGKAAKFKGTQTHVSNVKANDSGSESEISMMDDEELEQLGTLLGDKEGPAKQEDLGDPELRSVAPRKKPACIKMTASNSPGMDKTGPDDLLKPTLRDQLGLTDTPESSLPPSSIPQEEMENIDSYMRELPIVAEEGTECPICHEPVSQDSYWAFWKGLPKTVKNQALYCHTHRKATAQKDFESEGLQPILWDDLPRRIKIHRMVLHKILVGNPETPSIYRSRYEPLALTGKAAAVPSKRTDLPSSKQAELASYALDDNAVYPGYYGPRGRRCITEAVMALLSKEIKRCSDAVVQTSGPATFVQAVLVPEVAVRLIMEDCRCDWDVAEEVRERTYEMGVLLNEEIEDSIELGIGGEESEGENEYHY